MSYDYVLVGMALFTVLSLALTVRLWRRTSRARRFSAAHNAFVGMFFLVMAAVTSWLFYQALMTAETYCLGPRCRGDSVQAADDPVGYWILVAIWYTLAWLSLAAGFIMLLRTLK